VCATLNFAISCLFLSPCSGYWYTFAKENSRQYFKQGDIFPDFKSDWGIVFWQFDGEE